MADMGWTKYIEQVEIAESKGRQFSSLFPHVEDYPENIAETGVTQDTYFSYVSHAFLNGIINYTEPRLGFLVFGGDPTDADMDEIDTLLKIYNGHWHSKFSVFEHSKVYTEVVVLAESDNSYWLFWYDPDVSDCGVGRTDKSRVSWEQFLAGVLDGLNDYGQTRKLERLSGWLGW